jgi:hypothetical protein
MSRTLDIEQIKEKRIPGTTPQQKGESSLFLSQIEKTT